MVLQDGMTATSEDVTGGLNLESDLAVSRPEIQEIVDRLEQATAETAQWLARFHRSAVCKVAPEEDVVADDAHIDTEFGRWYESRRGSGVVDQDAFAALAATHQALYAHATILARRAWRDEKVPVQEYDALLEKVNAFNDQARRLAKAFRAALSDLDPLTGVQTRTSMERDLKREQYRAFRTRQPCSVALVDIDHFKRVNDTLGHLAGDRVLAAVTRLLNDGLRPYDSIYRFGGEEFLLCLPDTGPEQARSVLERVRKAIGSTPMDIGADQPVSITVSIGIAQLLPRRPIGEITARADQALYSAKTGGRNLVRVWTAESA